MTWNRQKLARVALPLYLGTIYATLGVVRTITNALREAELLRLTVALLFTCAAVAVSAVVIRSPSLRSVRVFAVLAIAAAAYAAIIWPMDSLEEKVHFLEYGLVALLAHEAAPAEWRTAVRFVSVALFVVAAGWLDEGIQAITPDRHYDLRDVGFNATAGLLALSTLTAVRQAGAKANERRES